MKKARPDVYKEGGKRRIHRAPAMFGKAPARRRHDPNANTDESPSEEELSAATQKASGAPLMQAVAEFVTRHRLRVEGRILAHVCDALSGENPKAAKVIAQREKSGQGIDQRWLSQFCAQRKQEQERIDQMEEMMGLMGKTIEEFQSTTRNAREATGAYNKAVSDRLGGIGEGARKDASSELQSLIDLSRAMLGQLRSIEAEIERNHAEAEHLRESLAKAKAEAELDFLTGLPNRRAFERYLTEHTGQALAEGSPLSIAFADVDHFKQVNDVHGHEAGDRVLKTIAEALSATSRDGCFVARHGGEEFAIVFPETDSAKAFELLDGARAKLASRRLMNRETGKPFGQITFSAGIAQMGSDGDARAALARADDALYRAKKEGRNRVLIA